MAPNSLTSFTGAGAKVRACSADGESGGKFFELRSMFEPEPESEWAGGRTAYFHSADAMSEDEAEAYVHATEQHPTIILLCFVW
jgi:hypothetical protein